MADRPKGYGLTSELHDKMEAKYDPGREREARDWLQAIVGGDFPQGSFHDALKDGVYLCKAMNMLRKGSVPRINSSKMAFKMMENIGSFLSAAEKYGVPRSDLFQTVDLYENQNMNQVITCIHALGRRTQVVDPSLPKLGPKEATKSVRKFNPEEQKVASNSVIGLQMGSNRGASQAGMTPYGLQRQVEKTNLKT